MLIISIISSCNWFLGLFINPDNELDTVFCQISGFEKSINETNSELWGDGSLKISIPGNSIKYDQLDLRLSAWDTKICHKIARQPFSPLIQNIYALQQVFYYLKGNIAEITILSNQEYNLQYSDNTPLNEIFLVHYRNCIPDFDNLNNDEIYERFKEEFTNWWIFYDLNEFLSENPTCKFELDFLIKSEFPPDSTREHIFTIYYKQNDGTYFTMEFEPVVISK